MDNKYNFSVASEDGELTIRTGEAAAIIRPRKIELSGQITAPAEWYTQKKAKGYGYDGSLLHVLVDRQRGRIVFHSNDDAGEELEGGHVITGKLELNAELAELHINNPRNTHTAAQIAALIRGNGLLFATREEHREVLSGLSGFKGEVTTKLKEENDFRGNVVSEFESKMRSDFRLEFDLKTPVFAGQEPQKFRVEIRFDIREREVNYWLESLELSEIIKGSRDAIIETQLEPFRADGLPIIEQ